MTIGSADRLPLGSAFLDRVLQDQLSKRSISLKSSSLTALREKCANTAESDVTFEDMVSGENAMEAAQEVELPDGQKVTITTEGCSAKLCRNASSADKVSECWIAWGQRNCCV